MAFSYKSRFEDALAAVRREGRYRVFADLKRIRGRFPQALWASPEGVESEVTVWCSNDYLGQGQYPVVLDAMHEAIDRAGSGSGGTRNISGTTTIMSNWKPSWPTCMARKPRCCSPAAMSPTRRRWKRFRPSCRA